MFSKFVSENKNPIAFAFAIMLIGTLAYSQYGFERNTFTLMKGATPKHFMVYYPGGFFKPFLSSGSLDQFKSTYENGTKLCPLIVGADEAAMMEKESLFKQPGDRINGFFGNNVVITGVIRKTNGPLDMFHLVSSDCNFVQ